MAVETGYSKIVASGSVFIYDTGDTSNSYIGEPTTNLVPSPYDYSTYAYVSGPVNTTVLNETGNTITSKRYTVTNAINVARAAIYPVTTTNTNYTFSFKWKYNGSTTATPTFTVSAAKGNPETANNSFNSESTTTAAIGNGWYLTVYTFNFSSNPTSGCILTFGLNTGGTASYVGETYDIYQAQFELKDHKTQYVLGTRSVSGSLLDVSGIGNSVNVSAASFNSSAQIILDGTGDYIRVAQNNLFYVNIWTWEMVVKFTGNTGNYQGLVWAEGDTGGGSGLQYLLTLYNNQYFHYRISNTITGWGFTNTSNITFTPTNYNHIVWQFNNGTTNTYINGVLFHSDASRGAYNGSTNSPIFLGARNDAAYGAPIIPSVYKYYNRALTASEVLTNFNHYKTRFNIT